MTVETTSNIVVYLGDGVADTFPFTFPVYDEDHLLVYTRVVDTRVMALVDASNYSVTGIGDENGGSVVVDDPAPYNELQVIITRQVDLTQDLDLHNQGGFYPNNVEAEFDLIEMQIQQHQEVLDRSVRGPLADGPWPVLDVAPARAGNLLGFTDDEDAFPTIADGSFLAAILATILVAGDGIEITYDSLTGTITITNTGGSGGSVEIPDAWLLESSVGGGGEEDDAEDFRDLLGATLLGLGCEIVVDDGADTVTVDLTQASTAEVIRDVMGTALVAGTGVIITPSDVGDTITIEFDGGAADAEFIRDTIGTAIVGGVGITSTVSDGSDTITLDIKPDIQSVVSAATVTPTFANNQVNVTAQAAALNLANPTGSAVDGHGILIRIKDNGTSRALTYGTKYREFADSLPSATTISKTLYIGIVYNAADDKWDVLGVREEA